MARQIKVRRQQRTDLQRRTCATFTNYLFNQQQQQHLASIGLCKCFTVFSVFMRIYFSVRANNNISPPVQQAPLLSPMIAQPSLRHSNESNKGALSTLCDSLSSHSSPGRNNDNLSVGSLMKRREEKITIRRFHRRRSRSATSKSPTWKCNWRVSCGDVKSC